MMEPVYLGDYSDADGEWEVIAHQGGQYVQQEGFTTRTAEDDDLSAAESDEEYAAFQKGELAPGKKKGGYDSRIEQILYENPRMPILITDAGKSSESGGKYIVYTIRTGVSCQLGAFNLY